MQTAKFRFRGFVCLFICFYSGIDLPYFSSDFMIFMFSSFSKTWLFALHSCFQYFKDWMTLFFRNVIRTSVSACMFQWMLVHPSVVPFVVFRSVGPLVGT